MPKKKSAKKSSKKTTKKSAKKSLKKSAKKTTSRGAAKTKPKKQLRSRTDGPIVVGPNPNWGDDLTGKGPGG